MRDRQKTLLVRRAVFVLLLVLAHLLQNAERPLPVLFGVRPYFLLSYTVCLGLFERELGGAVFGAFAGLLWDAVSPLGDGFYAFLFMLCGAACGLLVSTVMRNNLFTALLLSASAHLLFAVLYTVFFELARGVDHIGWLFLRYHLPSAAASVLFTPLIYLLVRAVMQRTRVR